MIGQPAFGSPKKRIKTYRHRKQNLSAGQVMSFARSYLGNELYYIGSQIERGNRNGSRNLKNALKKGWSDTKRALGVAAKAVWGFLKGIARDVFAPFYLPAQNQSKKKKLLKASEGLSDEERNDALDRFEDEAKKGYKTALSRFVNLVFPCVALAGMIIVFSTMLSLDYGLQINIGNRIIGYVSSETDFNNAKRIIEDRMVMTGETQYWNSDAVYYISVVSKDKLSTNEQLANSLLLASGSDISEATGLYVGGVFMGATTDTQSLTRLRDGILDEYTQQYAHVDGSVIRYTREVELVDGIYMTSTLRSMDYFEKLFSGENTEPLTYVVKEGDTAAKIAGLNGITLATLKNLNGEVDFDTLAEGTELLLSKDENLFSVKIVVYRTYTRTIPYTYETYPDPRWSVGYFNVITPGKNGEMEIVEEIEYKNGRAVSRTTISEKTLSDPVPYSVVVGIKPIYSNTSSMGTGVLRWPTGRYQFVSRGFIVGQHGGIDIAARQGTEVYAVDNGVVVLNAYFNDYGNFIIVSHRNGMQTAYAHLDSPAFFGVGEVVSKGTVIGVVGSTGRSTGYHLHFEVRLQGVRVDPQGWIDGTYQWGN